jgi:23S rRNA pseudouridine2604 synthase
MSTAKPKVPPKPTLTLKKKPDTTGHSSASHVGEPRRYSTRAKNAARRDGRTLDYQLPKAPKPSATPDESSRAPKPETRRAEGRGRKDGSSDGGEGDRVRRRRDTSGSELREPNRAPREQRDTLNDRRKSREVDATKRDAAKRDATIAPAATLAREPDGLVRVSKLLSEQGLCSRREADSYIARGWVWADGQRVTELGTRVLPTAKLRLDRQAAVMQESRVTVLLHKPVGYVSGQAEDGYEPASVLVTAEHQLPSDMEKFRPEVRRGLAPAGRLDIDSTGLLVLTQDGRIAKQLIGEDSEVEKEYLVRVQGTLSAEDLARLNHGLELDGEALKPARVKWQNEDQLNFVLKEGKKRQIRRMCELVGLTVVGLKRIRIGRVVLGDLPVGKWRFLWNDEAF